MQSEFACHGGMMCSFFCRACWVESKACEAAEDDDGYNVHRAPAVTVDDDAQSIASDHSGSMEGSPEPSRPATPEPPTPPIQRGTPEPPPQPGTPEAPQTAPTGRRKKLETMDEMVSRISSFMKVTQLSCTRPLSNLPYRSDAFAQRARLLRPSRSRRRSQRPWLARRTSKRLEEVLGSRTPFKTSSSRSYALFPLVRALTRMQR
jgi:hypothetical protein